MPTARSSPISRVRSNTDSMSVLTIPMSAIITASAEQRVDQAEQLVDLATCDCSNCARVWTCTFG